MNSKPPAAEAQAPGERGRPLRVLFMGTPQFAVPSLESLLAAGHEVVLTVSAPPRRAGRGLHVVQPPVAQAASQHGIEVFQPERVRDPESLARIVRAEPDVIVVVAYGQILPPALLAIPALGCLNVHPALLPRHRGAAPIPAAVLAGDKETGISIMLMDAGMDTGPVLSQTRTIVEDVDDQVTLSARLARMGADLLLDTLPRWAAGAVSPGPQNAADATLTRPTRRADGVLDWHQSARDLWRRIRAFAEWPQGQTWWEGKLLRIASAAFDPTVNLEAGLVQAWGPPRRSPTAAAIGTGAGVLLPGRLQLEGARPLPVDAFLRGHPSWIGARLQARASS